ncbi:MAG: class III signal peptide-containing protein [Methanobacterium sp.]|nr:class III signal peptide-containing protein [Methanobacterium sp.]
MNLLEDETAQGSAELVLLFGGIIVIALVALISYQSYLKGLGNEINGTQLNETTNDILNLTNKFQ